MEKFKYVLGSMGIQLEIFESSQPSVSPSPRSASVRSLPESPDQTGTFPLSPHYHGRRRRNSDSLAPFHFDHPQGVPAPSDRARSVSPTGSRSLGGELLRFAGGDRYRRPPSRHGWVRRGDAYDAEDEGASEVFTQDVPDFARRAPLDHNDREATAPTTGHDIFDPADAQNLRASHPEDGSDGFLGASDTTALTSDDRAPYPIQYDERYAALEGKVQSFRNKHQKSELARAIGAWRTIANWGAQDNMVMESGAIRMDQHSILLEAFEIWRENATIAREDRLVAAGPYLDPARQAKLERRAERAHSILLLHKAFTHWTACTRDETERTAVARRHILRKRCFSAWRSQQSADEAKMRNFRLQSILRLWSRSCIHQEVRMEVAVEKYHHSLAKSACETWRAEYMARLADELRTCRIKERCVATWLSKSREAVALYGSCALYDERLLLEDTLATWQAEYEETRTIGYGCIQQKLALDCQRILNEWRTQATLKKQLSSFTEAQDWQIKQQTLDTWAASTIVARRDALAAERVVLRDSMIHWRNEAKLKLFEISVNEQQKTQAISQWVLQHKLVRFRQSADEKVKARALSTIRTTFNEAKLRSDRGLDVSDYFAARTVQASTISKWWATLEATRRRRRLAVALSFYTTASQSINLWLARQAEASASAAEYEERATSGSYYCTVANALSSWSSTAEAASRERLTRTYHAAKRKYRVNLATKYLSKWRRASGDSLAFSWYAEQLCASQLKTKLADQTQHWNTCAKRIQAVREVAAGAELEVWWGRWSASAAQLREYELDAAEYSSVQTLARCWKAWDFAALQYKNRQYTVATIREKNDQRLRRHVLSAWSNDVGPERTLQDMRASSTSKRSLRLGSVRQGSRFHVPETPRFSRSAIPLSTSPFQQLSHIPEADERSKASDRRFMPPMQPYDPSSVQQQDEKTLGSRELSRSVPRRPNRYLSQGDGTRDMVSRHFRSEGPASKPLVSFPGAYVTRGPYGSSINPPRDSLHYQETPDPTAERFGSPSQLGPMSDFDDESFAPGEMDDPAFMSTPSRWAGPLKQHDHLATLTPSAILSTPYERALREEYGGAGAFLAPNRTAGHAAAKETPRVTFADIREESGEYEEGYGLHAR